MTCQLRSECSPCCAIVGDHLQPTIHTPSMRWVQPWLSPAHLIFLCFLDVNYCRLLEGLADEIEIDVMLTAERLVEQPGLGSAVAILHRRSLNTSGSDAGCWIFARQHKLANSVPELLRTRSKHDRRVDACLQPFRFVGACTKLFKTTIISRQT